jgi:hypothetical protein
MAPSFFHIHVHQLAGAGTFVTAHRPTGGTVQPRQPWHPVPDQHPVHGRGRHPHDPGDTSRPEPPVPTQRNDRRLDLRVGASRAGMRAAGPVHQAGGTLIVEPVQPLVGSRPRDSHLDGDMSGRTTSQHTLHQQQTRPRRQTGLSVDHEDLRAVKTRHLHCARRSSSRQAPNPSTRSMGITSRRFSGPPTAPRSSTSTEAESEPAAPRARPAPSVPSGTFRRGGTLLPLEIGGGNACRS